MATDAFRENPNRSFSISSVFMTLFVAQFIILQIVMISVLVVHEGNCQFDENYDEQDNFDMDSDFLQDNDDNQWTNQVGTQENYDTEDNEIEKVEESSIGKFTQDNNKDDSVRYEKNRNTTTTTTSWFQRKITIPAGTTLSLTTQVSRPDIMPGFFYDVDGIIMDAVVEVPIWMNVNKFLKAAYEGSLNAQDEDSDEKSLAGYERCFLYEKLESYSTRVMEMSPLISHMCLLRAICEAQRIAVYYQDPPTNIAFELIHLLLTPSLGVQDDCYLPYLAAETIGLETGQCSKYATFCPLNIEGILLSNFFPPDEYD